MFRKRTSSKRELDESETANSKTWSSKEEEEDVRSKSKAKSVSFAARAARVRDEDEDSMPPLCRRCKRYKVAAELDEAEWKEKLYRVQMEWPSYDDLANDKSRDVYSVLQATLAATVQELMFAGEKRDQVTKWSIDQCFAFIRVRERTKFFPSLIKGFLDVVDRLRQDGHIPFASLNCSASVLSSSSSGASSVTQKASVPVQDAGSVPAFPSVSSSSSPWHAPPGPAVSTRLFASQGFGVNASGQITFPSNNTDGPTAAAAVTTTAAAAPSAADVTGGAAASEAN